MGSLVARLQSGKILLMDGAMGTELQRRGARLGEECLELWSLSRPDDVRAIHRAYAEAEAELLLTHTFQATPQALAKYGLAERLHDIWAKALAHARQAGQFVLADIGPLGQADPEIFRRLMDCCAGADGILLETWSSPADVQHFASCQRSRGPDLPLLVSFTFRRVGDEGRLQTFTGASPEECARAAEACGPAALGANCGAEIEMADLLDIVRRYRAVSNLPLFVRPNAGTPERHGEEWVYPRSPERMAAGLSALLDAGVVMVGGCCGTTPAHIAAFRQVIDRWQEGRSV